MENVFYSLNINQHGKCFYYSKMKPRMRAPSLSLLNKWHNLRWPIYKASQTCPMILIDFFPFFAAKNNLVSMYFSPYSCFWSIFGTEINRRYLFPVRFSITCILYMQLRMFGIAMVKIFSWGERWDVPFHDGTWIYSTAE